jgi:hypothetical protein
VLSPGTRGVVADINRFVEQSQAADTAPRLNSGMLSLRYVGLKEIEILFQFF